MYLWIYGESTNPTFIATICKEIQKMYILTLFVNPSNCKVSVTDSVGTEAIDIIINIYLGIVNVHLP